MFLIGQYQYVDSVAFLLEKAAEKLPAMSLSYSSFCIIQHLNLSSSESDLILLWHEGRKKRMLLLELTSSAL